MHENYDNLRTYAVQKGIINFNIFTINLSQGTLSPGLDYKNLTASGVHPHTPLKFF